MATYRELLQQVRSEIAEVDATAGARADRLRRPLVLDVREQDEWDEGHIPGAVHIPRGYLESRVERAAPDRTAPVVVYCSRRQPLGVRGEDARGARLRGRRHPRRRLHRLEAQRLSDVQLQVGWTRQRRARYSRHLLIPEVGEEGQLKLLDSQGPADRRRRPRLARLALPRRGGRRPHRHRRRRRRRRVEPAAPDRPLDRVARRAEGRVGEARRSRR